ncbi:MAG: hypothetical protein HC783_18920 [Rhodobacteraceae bacterium]|nr:hypothetical protein [Paracoccaceae bacterium]
MSAALKGVLCGLLGFGLFSLADATIKFLGGTFSPVQIVAFAGLFTLPLIGLLWLSAPVSLRPVYPGLMAVRTVALIGNGRHALGAGRCDLLHPAADPDPAGMAALG